MDSGSIVSHSVSSRTHGRACGTSRLAQCKNATIFGMLGLTAMNMAIQAYRERLTQTMVGTFNVSFNKCVGVPVPVALQRHRFKFIDQVVNVLS